MDHRGSCCSLFNLLSFFLFLTPHFLSVSCTFKIYPESSHFSLKVQYHFLKPSHFHFSSGLLRQLLNWSIGSTLGGTYAQAGAQVTLLTYTSYQVRSSTQNLWAPHCTQGKTQTPTPASTPRIRLSEVPGPLLLPL